MANWKKLRDAVIVDPGDKVRLSERDTDCKALLPDKAEGEARLLDDAVSIDVLQDRLYAERKRSLLVVLQGIDTSGKDGTVRGVFNHCGPLGVIVTPFGVPSAEEMAHDYLWRVHAAAPKKGVIGVFNRSHYEDVLIVKVKKFAPAKVIEERYEQINDFERYLTDNGTVILKFMLHISKDEQRDRLQQRLDKPEHNWKFNPSDLEDRKLWNDYQGAYETALTRCSTKIAPWHVIPADKKWRRNVLIAAIVRGTLDEMDPRYPKPDWKPSDFKIE